MNENKIISKEKLKKEIEKLEEKRDSFNRNSSEYIEVDNIISEVNRIILKCEI